jgi:hypothetical protein
MAKLRERPSPRFAVTDPGRHRETSEEVKKPAALSRLSNRRRTELLRRVFSVIAYVSSVLRLEQIYDLSAANLSAGL